MVLVDSEINFNLLSCERKIETGSRQIEMKIKLFPFPESDDQMCCQMPKVNTKVFQNLFVKCLICILLFKLVSKKILDVMEKI